jgi:hypothetical protein
MPPSEFIQKDETIACLLCGFSKVRIDDSLTGRQLRSLWRAAGLHISPQAFGPISDDTNVSLMSCCACGFRFYDPDFSGGADFYEEMMSVCPYPAISPEFKFAIEFANKNNLKRLLDVGGGEGHFLDLARKAGLATCGVELNRKAARAASEKGHRMLYKPIEEVSSEELNGGAEILTLFQVIEHVSSPVQFLFDASRLVQPGGYIVIAVPSEKRMLGLLHHDPANWPPHHTSRWRIEDLVELGQKAGLSLVKRGSDRLTGKSILWAIKLHNRFAETLGYKKIKVSSKFLKFFLFCYRFSGCKFFMPFHGLSIYAVFKKPYP